MRALSLGAADYIAKPSAAALSEGLPFEQEVVEKIGGLARLRRMTATAFAAAADTPRPLALRPQLRLAPALIAIGSSTGGPQALFNLLGRLQGRAHPHRHRPAYACHLYAYPGGTHRPAREHPVHRGAERRTAAPRAISTWRPAVATCW